MDKDASCRAAIAEWRAEFGDGLAPGMVALSVRQPFAHAIASGRKAVENRSRAMGHAGDRRPTVPWVGRRCRFCPSDGGACGSGLHAGASPAPSVDERVVPWK